MFRSCFLILSVLNQTISKAVVIYNLPAQKPLLQEVCLLSSLWELQALQQYKQKLCLTVEVLIGTQEFRPVHALREMSNSRTIRFILASSLSIQNLTLQSIFSVV